VTPNPSPTASSEPEADLAGSGVHLLRLTDSVRIVCQWSVDRLAKAIEDPSVPRSIRHAAGLQLALVGDPRIDVFAPAMVTLAARSVPVGLALTRIDSVTAEWADMGVQRDWIAKEAPQHMVHIESFKIARYPVTNVEYLRFVLADPAAERPTCWAHGVFPLGAANQPVYSVSPEAADSYVHWLSQVTNREFRLPTEVEWEYAATGGDGRQFPWGEAWDPERANTAESGPLTSTPVGMYADGYSPHGLADMAGNVEEYVSTDYYPYPGADEIRDDLVDVHGASYRIARGGSYARHGDLARCSRRHGWYPSDHFAMGFRLAETLR
jgi:toxoflavin biosynthesis protein ToxD